MFVWSREEGANIEKGEKGGKASKHLVMSKTQGVARWRGAQSGVQVLSRGPYRAGDAQEEANPASEVIRDDAEAERAREQPRHVDRLRHGLEMIPLTDQVPLTRTRRRRRRRKRRGEEEEKKEGRRRKGRGRKGRGKRQLACGCPGKRAQLFHKAVRFSKTNGMKHDECQFRYDSRALRANVRFQGIAIVSPW